VARDDGLELRGAWITAPVRCAPPANKPSVAERDRCLPYLERELALLPARVLVPLGGFAYQVVCSLLGVPRRPPFAHGVEVALGDGRWVVGSYHVSQQNTFTGKLTPSMLDAVLHRARDLAENGP
jgi:uracil-DNA glycosylase